MYLLCIQKNGYGRWEERFTFESMWAPSILSTMLLCTTLHACQWCVLQRFSKVLRNMSCRIDAYKLWRNVEENAWAAVHKLRLVTLFTLWKYIHVLFLSSSVSYNFKWLLFESCFKRSLMTFPCFQPAGMLFNFLVLKNTPCQHTEDEQISLEYTRKFLS